MRSIPIILTFLVCAGSLFGQMPDWSFFRDREGNSYYYTSSGRIIVTGKVEKKRFVVSAEGIDYYLALARRLAGEGRPGDALAICHGILALKDSNMRIRDAAAGASQLMRELQLRHGDRYPNMRYHASLYLYREGGRTVIIDEEFRHSLGLTIEPRILSVSDRRGQRYAHRGLRMGVDLPASKPAREGFDLLLAIDAERFAGPLRNADQLITHWELRRGKSNWKREVLSRDEYNVLVRYTIPGEGTTGLERYHVMGRYGYCVRLLTTEDIWNERSDELEEIVTSWSFVRETEQQGGLSADVPVPALAAVLPYLLWK